jgi:cell division transport system permease protein
MSIFYVIKEGFAGFNRAKLAAIGSVVTITISLLFLGMFYVISDNTSRIVDDLRSKVEIEAFLEEPASKQKIDDVRKELLSIEGIEKIEFISKEQAAKIFKQEFGEDINSVLDFNPLPPSFKIYLKEQYRTSQHAEAIQKRTKSIKGVDDVIYRKELLEFLDHRTTTLYALGLGFGIIIGISAILLVSNTIRLTIYAKRKAIQTMKLVGASRFFIRAPFIIEGIVQGMVGGMIATAILYYLITFATELVSHELAEFIRVDVPFYGFVILVGCFLGFLGSTISIRKFIGETVVS